jgi:uncharacterized protein
MPRVVHFEIHAEKPEKAVEFYSKVFGWKIQKWDGPVDYWLVSTGSADERGIDGGIMRRHGPGPVDMQAVNSYVCTINVSNLDEYAGKVTANGGINVLPRMAVPGVGWLAYYKDTQGNIFGMMQNDPNAK